VTMRLVRAEDPEFAVRWAELWDGDELQYPLYQARNRDYYVEYHRASRFTDASAVVVNGGAAVAGVRLALREDELGSDLAAHGQPMLLLESASAMMTQRRQAARILRDEVARVVTDARARTVSYQEFMRGDRLSPFAEELLQLGARARPVYTRVLRLDRPEPELRADVSRRTKGHINWGERNLTLTVLTPGVVRPEDLEAFRQLHREAAGFESRSVRSWQLQYEMIRAGEAFAVFAFHDGALASASLFCHSARYCYYGVGASRRALFDRPISHVVMWRGIQHARQIGCVRFETGEQRYPNDDPSPPTEKELGIVRFKASFGGDTVMRLRLTLEDAPEAVHIAAITPGDSAERTAS
jgi:Acetyltransferase (GNAT) domain